MVSTDAIMRRNSAGSSTKTSFDFRPSAPGESSASLVCSSSIMNEEGMRCVALQLPREVITRVFSQLDYRDLIHCSLACKQWHSDSGDLREGWKEEYWEACSVRGLIQWDTNPPRARYEAYLACSPD